MRKLTPQESAWVDLVVAGESDIKAYQQAYKASPATAKKSAYLIRKRPEIQAEIARRRLNLRDRSEIEQDQLIEQLAAWLRLDPLDYLPVMVNGIAALENIPIEARRAITAIEETKYGIKLRWISKERTMEMLLRQFGSSFRKLLDTIDVSRLSEAQLAKLINEQDPDKAIISILLESFNAPESKAGG